MSVINLLYISCCDWLLHKMWQHLLHNATIIKHETLFFLSWKGPSNPLSPTKNALQMISLMCVEVWLLCNSIMLFPCDLLKVNAVDGCAEWHCTLALLQLEAAYLSIHTVCPHAFIWLQEFHELTKVSIWFKAAVENRFCKNYTYLFIDYWRLLYQKCC